MRAKCVHGMFLPLITVVQVRNQSHGAKSGQDIRRSYFLALCWACHLLLDCLWEQRTPAVFPLPTLSYRIHTPHRNPTNKAKQKYNQTMNKVAPSWVFLLYISHTLAYISEHWAELPLGRKVKQPNYLLFFKHFVQNTCCMTSCAGEENFAVKSDPRMETSKERLLLFSPSSASNHLLTKEWGRGSSGQTETEVTT